MRLLVTVYPFLFFLHYVFVPIMFFSFKIYVGGGQTLQQQLDVKQQQQQQG
jgi:hypothetical protein